MLSHLGVKQDRTIAQKYPEFDVIIGSHTHHLFVKGELDNNVLLAAAGKYGHYIGEITLELNNHHVISKKKLGLLKPIRYHRKLMILSLLII